MSSKTNLWTQRAHLDQWPMYC